MKRVIHYQICGALEHVCADGVRVYERVAIGKRERN